MRIKIGLAILCLLLIGVFAFSGEVIKGNFSEITLNGDRRTTWPTVAFDNGEINAAYGHFSDLVADWLTATGGILDNVVIGDDYPQYGAFSPFVGTGVNIDNGSIDNVIIGESVPEIGYFTTLTSTYANFDDLAVASGFTSGGTSTVSGLFYSESLWVNDNVLISGAARLNAGITVSGASTFDNEVQASSYSTTAADGEHFINVANSTAPTDNVTVGDCYYDNVDLGWLCWNGSAWAGASGDITASSTATFTNKTFDPAGDNNVFTHYAQKDFTILDPVAADNSMLFKARYAMTVSNVHCLAQGGGSITLQILECDSAGANCAGIDGSTTITCDSDGAADDGSLLNASIDAGDWVQVLYGAPSGTVNTLTYSIYYSESQ